MRRRTCCNRHNKVMASRRKAQHRMANRRKVQLRRRMVRHLSVRLRMADRLGMAKATLFNPRTNLHR